MSAVPVAFYAPLKPPDHPRPSGDRTMARLLLRALQEAGFDPSIASRLRTWEPTGDAARQCALQQAGMEEAARFFAAYRALSPGERPRLWFTYHCYYKAPDHLGPEIARRLGIPYVVAEASRAPKRAAGSYALGNAAAEAAIDAADLLLVLTEHDRECLERAIRPGQNLVRLPPFIGPSPAGSTPPRPGADGTPRLLVVAMMRDGDKLASYRLLARSLRELEAQPWSLDIVGDGPARPEIERLFALFGTRVALHGALEETALAGLYAAADILVWPAVNEAYGMVLLEAQAQGCPVVAGGYGGVPDVVMDGKTGLIVPPGDAGAFASAVMSLLADPVRRAALGLAARQFVMRERSLEAAARILGDALTPLVRLPSAA